MDEEEMQDLFRRGVLALERLSYDIEKLVVVATEAEGVRWTPEGYNHECAEDEA